ncbi:MAG: PEP-CTERM sorting domain-containing protein [Methylophilus sp.]|uniref:PEP-CTERM sorting domain-containing protein n=1 Tax=Methylophilus sp. TaxID=29541 RepID=UPI003FA001DD
MKKWMAALAFLGAANAASAASATVITFDDLTGVGALPANYQGFTWTGWTYFDTVDENPFTPASGFTRAFVDVSANSFTSATAFVFNGSFLSGFGEPVLDPETEEFGDPDTVQYLLYKNNILVFESTIFSSLSATPTYFASGFNGLVDKVVYKSAYGVYTVDNVTYTASAVPEPESISLLLAGLGVTGLMRRRTQKKAATIA